MSPAGLQDPQTRTSDFDRPLGFLHEAPAADAHALAALEFSRVLDAVAGFAGTSLGADAVRALVPRAVAGGDADALAAISVEHARVAAIGRVIGGEEAWPSPSIPALRPALARLAVEGTTWNGAELRDAIVLLTSSRLVLSVLRGARSRGADVEALTPHAFALISDAALEESLGRVVDDEGIVRDGATPELRRVRKQLRGAEAELIRLLEQVMGRLESHHRVDDASVTMRNGRWVIPVRREGRGSVGGIVHDTSATGATVFVEPPAAVEFGNRIRELEIAERREVERVLAEATAALRPRHDDLVGVLAALVDLDALVARARFADRYACAPCALAPAGSGFAIVSGRHPLLAARDPRTVVPFGLELLPGEHTLLVSGPNTGGKTVFLKAIALLALMAQAGVPPTVGPESTVPLFDRVFADIGDEQSIEASLSTFSGHVRNLVDIVLHATPASLVLADELGSGTDPNEGAALGAAVLEALTRRGTTTVATTHLGVLKQLAQEVPGVVNASLQFDEALLAPTYRLLKGIPGRSYGLSIARRLAMPPEILVNAEARVPEQERRAAALIEDLERRQREVEERERRADEKEESYAERADRVLAREQAVKARERQVERTAHDEARKYVLEARKDPANKPKRGEVKGPRILVLVPTRELSMQVAKAASDYGRNVPWLTVTSVVGGVPYPAQLKALRSPLDILIATPGRLIDHIQSGKAVLDNVEMLVLDEADRMLDMGFIEDIEHIAEQLPAKRQTLMASATFDGEVGRLAQRLQKDDVERIEIAGHTAKHENITQQLMWADSLDHKKALLDSLLTDRNVDQAVVFTSTQVDADFLADRLADMGHRVAALHGGMPQGRRNRVLQGLRSQIGRAHV